jgi:hypothetical protein
MSVAAAAILEGMPDPRDLHRIDADGETVILAGSAELTAVTVDDSDWAQIADLFEQPRPGRQHQCQDDAPGRYVQARALVFLAWNLTLRKVSGCTRLG